MPELKAHWDRPSEIEEPFRAHPLLDRRQRRSDPCRPGVALNRNITWQIDTYTYF